jgi:hypothetical protein
MLSLFLWLAGIVLEFLLLARAIQTGNLARYSYFYAYIFCVFTVSAGLYVVQSFDQQYYTAWYWPTQFATLAIGFGVVLEVVRQSLADYPGAERFAWRASCAVFVVTFCFAEWHVASRTEWFARAVTVDLERDLRVTEALVLATVMAIVFLYRIELGRNVKGMIVGFGAYVGMSLTTLALRSFLGPRFNTGWSNLQTASYFFALIVWTATLWNYSPNPKPPIPRRDGDGGYGALVGDTRAQLESVRSNLREVAR